MPKLFQVWHNVPQLNYLVRHYEPKLFHIWHNVPQLHYLVRHYVPKLFHVWHNVPQLHQVWHFMPKLSWTYMPHYFKSNITCHNCIKLGINYQYYFKLGIMHQDYFKVDIMCYVISSQTLHATIPSSYRPYALTLFQVIHYAT